MPLWTLMKEDMDFLFTPSDGKRIFRDIIFNYDHITTSHRLRSSPSVLRSRSSSLLRIFNGFSFHPILKKNGFLFSNLISWIIGATTCFSDKPGQETAADGPEGCRLCSWSEETRQHLLTDCPGTAHLIRYLAVESSHYSTSKRGWLPYLTSRHWISNWKESQQGLLKEERCCSSWSF